MEGGGAEGAAVKISVLPPSHPCAKGGRLCTNPSPPACTHLPAQITASGEYAPLCTFLETLLTMIW